MALTQKKIDWLTVLLNVEARQAHLNGQEQNMAQTIVYISGDEVNRAYVQGIQLAPDITVAVGHAADDIPAGPLAALIYDLDSLNLSDRADVIDGLAAAPPAQLTAVHSYHLDEPRTDELQLQGVVVRKQLDESMIHRLATVVVAGRDAA